MRIRLMLLILGVVFAVSACTSSDPVVLEVTREVPVTVHVEKETMEVPVPVTVEVEKPVNVEIPVQPSL